MLCVHPSVAMMEIMMTGWQEEIDLDDWDDCDDPDYLDVLDDPGNPDDLYDLNDQIKVSSQMINHTIWYIFSLEFSFTVGFFDHNEQHWMQGKWIQSSYTLSFLS